MATTSERHRDQEGRAKAASEDSTPGNGPLSALRALLLLGGSVRPTQLHTAIDRSLLDLPIDTDRTVLDHWRDQSAELASKALQRRLSVRVIIDRTAKEPLLPSSCKDVLISVERDPYEFRGTGGLIRDLCVDYADDEFVLVANAAHVLLDPLVELAEAMAGRGGDIVVIAHEDDTPSGLMLIRCGCLRRIAPQGFVDMKEQALPAIADNDDVFILKRKLPSGMSIRTLPEYLHTLRRYHRQRSGEPAHSDAFKEEWRAAFAIVQEGATVSSDARVHDSVVLHGARVENGAVLVRSIVCPGSVVKRDEMIVDQLVGATNGNRSRGKGNGA